MGLHTMLPRQDVHHGRQHPSRIYSKKVSPIHNAQSSQRFWSFVSLSSFFFPLLLYRVRPNPRHQTAFSEMIILPLELFDQIISNLVEYTTLKTERFSVLTLTSRKSILSARVLWGNYRYRDPLRQIFLCALVEVPFMVSDPAYEVGGLAGLDELSRSPYAPFVTTLSFCPLVRGRLPDNIFLWPASTLQSLISLA